MHALDHASPGEMTIIADSRVIRCERFLADVTPRRATVRLPLLFRQRFHGYVNRYQIFHAMRQVLKLPTKPLVATRTNCYCDGTNTTITRRRTRIACSVLWWILHADDIRRTSLLDSIFRRTHSRSAKALIPDCYSCRIWAICCPRSAIKWHSRLSYHNLQLCAEMKASANRGIIFLFTVF